MEFNTTKNRYYINCFDNRGNLKVVWSIPQNVIMYYGRKTKLVEAFTTYAQGKYSLPFPTEKGYKAAYKKFQANRTAWLAEGAPQAHELI